jgi:ABC-type branched-subunit amino acid transport system substrate-binding protein
MRIKYIAFLLLLVLCGCTSNDDKKTISIAVTGSPSSYSRYYEQGVKRAYEALKKEYPDYNIVCEFYDDKDDYATAEQITSKLVNDDSVTAILASPSPEICANQAYQADKNGKLLVCPHWIYDDTLTDNSYSNVFAINYSSEYIGNAMGFAAGEAKEKRWALCYADDEISKAELRGFGNMVNEEVDVVDSVKINVLESEFNKTIERWRLLGVEGVVFLPYSSDFELLYKLKGEIPSLAVISDASMDDEQELENNKEYFNNVYVIDSFYVSGDESELFPSNGTVDTWEVHGYNALRMIVDTAVKNDTTKPAEIAAALHNDGYQGELESYSFNSNGSLISSAFSYTAYDEDMPARYVLLADKE